MLTRSRSPSSGSRAIGRATRRWTLAVTVAASSESYYETRAAVRVRLCSPKLHFSITASPVWRTGRNFSEPTSSRLPYSCHEPADSGGMGRNEGGSGGIEVHQRLQSHAREVRVSQRVSRIRSASLRFPPPPQIFSNNIGLLRMACAAHPRPKWVGSLARRWGRAPAPWSTPGPRLLKLWSGRAIRGGSGGR